MNVNESNIEMHNEALVMYRSIQDDEYEDNQVQEKKWRHCCAMNGESRSFGLCLDVMT